MFDNIAIGSGGSDKLLRPRGLSTSGRWPTRPIPTRFGREQWSVRLNPLGAGGHQEGLFRRSGHSVSFVIHLRAVASQNPRFLPTGAPIHSVTMLLAGPGQVTVQSGPGLLYYPAPQRLPEAAPGTFAESERLDAAGDPARCV